jgi:hypothetical protein
MLHQINTHTKISGIVNAISKTNLMNNSAKLALDITNECSLTSADPFDACNKQTQRGLCNRYRIHSPFGGVHKILCMDPLQQKPVDGEPLCYGEAIEFTKHILQIVSVMKHRHKLKYLELLPAQRCFNILQKLLI